MALSTYISELRNALRYPGAHEFYFPRDRQLRRERNLRLAREIGWGLAISPPEQVQDILGTLYGQIVVANSLDTTGVVIDNKDWLTELRTKLSLNQVAP